MDGKKREPKLICSNGATMFAKEMLIEVRKILEPFSPTEFENPPIISYYRDTYYDDIEASLYKSGGSLKIRIGVNGAGINERTLVMRTKTQNVTKLKSSILWDEVELPVNTLKKVSLEEKLEPLKAFFPYFDFQKINPKSVLICETSRSLYKIDIQKDDEEISISFLFDHIKYEKDGKIANDSLLKIRGKKISELLLNLLYQGLMEKFPEYYLDESSRYERALNKLQEV